MDQVQIGKFIAERRKHSMLTQMQLAEKLGITDRAVSKWETGKSLPDSSIMLELCAILEITVNDLLSGEVVTMENQTQEMEKKLLELVRQKEDNDRRLLTLEWVIVILSCIVLFIPLVIANTVSMEEWIKHVIIIAGFVPFLIGMFFAVRIEQVAGYYECKHCKHRYIPTFRSVTFAIHIGRTRYMRCPKCNRKSWQKKVLTKE